MTELAKKWYSGILKDYTCSLILGKDGARPFMLLHSLLRGCHGEAHILTHRRDAMWGRPVKEYTNAEELQRGLALLLQRDNAIHTTFILDLGIKLTPELQTQISRFLRTKREHNTTLIVLCEDLSYLGDEYYHFDLVFHTLPSGSGDSQYHRWVNEANKQGILITDSLDWLRKRDPGQMSELSIIGTYSF